MMDDATPAEIDIDLFNSGSDKASAGKLGQVTDAELLSLVNGYAILHNTCLGELRRRYDVRGEMAPPARLN